MLGLLQPRQQFGVVAQDGGVPLAHRSQGIHGLVHLAAPAGLPSILFQQRFQSGAMGGTLLLPLGGLGYLGLLVLAGAIPIAYLQRVLRKEPLPEEVEIGRPAP